MSSRKAYYSPSMMVTRLTGIPYRQNHMTVNAENGRILVRSEAVEILGLTEDDYCMLRGIPGGGMAMEIHKDPRGLLGQHIRRVTGQENMQWYQHQMARQLCNMLHVTQLRLRMTIVQHMSDNVRLVHLERVDDICEHTHWDDRSKDKRQRARRG